MRLLFLAGSGPHSHDYGLAFLFDGLCEVLGYDNVIDYPENPTFHLSAPSDRDACNLDSDLYFPKRTTPVLDDLAPTIDAIVMGVPDVTAYRVCRHPKLRTKPIIAVDMSDQVADLRRIYESTSGRPVAAYCKRELPLDADWGHALPLCYPKSRVPNPMPKKEARIVYHATDHNGGSPGIPRRAIVAALKSSVADSALDVSLYRGQEKGTRPDPEVLHEKMASGLIGISWNGAANWQSNRFFENFAFGLAQVSERPKHRLPNTPEDGKHCKYADAPAEAAEYVEYLLRNEAMARQMASAGHAYFSQHHTSEARARQLLEIMRKT